MKPFSSFAQWAIKIILFALGISLIRSSFGRDALPFVSMLVIGLVTGSVGTLFALSQFAVKDDKHEADSGFCGRCGHRL